MLYPLQNLTLLLYQGLNQLHVFLIFLKICLRWTTGCCLSVFRKNFQFFVKQKDLGFTEKKALTIKVVLLLLNTIRIFLLFTSLFQKLRPTFNPKHANSIIQNTLVIALHIFFFHNQSDKKTSVRFVSDLHFF